MYGINTNACQYYERLQTPYERKVVLNQPNFPSKFSVASFHLYHRLSKGSLVFTLTNFTSYIALGIIPTRANTGRLHPKQMPFSGFRYMKG